MPGKTRRRGDAPRPAASLIIRAMQPLRSARFLARLMLAWFVLAIGVAVASPVVQPRGLELVCAGGGLKLLQQGGDGEALPSVGLDCPLCATAAAPPPAAAEAALPVLAHAAAVAPIRCTHVATLLPSPPARGPPAQPFT